MIMNRANWNLLFCRYKELFQTYFYWIAFLLILNILTNAVGSITLIQAYRLDLLDIATTYGFMLFLTSIEAVLISCVFIFIQLLFEKIFGNNLNLLFRRLILLAFMLTWINIFLTALNQSSL